MSCDDEETPGHDESDPAECSYCCGSGDCDECEGVGCAECNGSGECFWCMGTGDEDGGPDE